MPDNLSSTEAQKTEEEKKQEEKLKGFYVCQTDDELTEKTKKALLELSDLANIKDQRHKIKNDLRGEFVKRTSVDRKDLDPEGENKKAMFGTDEKHLLMTQYPDGMLDFKNIGKFKSSAVVQRRGDDGSLIDSYDIITYSSEGEISAFIEGELGTSRLKEIDLFRNIARDLEKNQSQQTDLGNNEQRTTSGMETQTENNSLENHDQQASTLAAERLEIEDTNNLSNNVIETQKEAESGIDQTLTEQRAFISAARKFKTKDINNLPETVAQKIAEIKISGSTDVAREAALTSGKVHQAARIVFAHLAMNGDVESGVDKIKEATEILNQALNKLKKSSEVTKHEDKKSQNHTETIKQPEQLTGLMAAVKKIGNVLTALTKAAAYAEQSSVAPKSTPNTSPVPKPDKDHGRTGPGL